MLLNVDQLQKKLDKDESQEDGSMAAFWVVKNQFQKFIDSQFTLDYDSQMTDKYFVEYTGIKWNRIKSANDINKSGNDTDADDADIIPIYDEEPMAEVQLTAGCNIFTTRQQHTEQPEIINEDSRKGFCNCCFKNDLRKLKGNSVDTKHAKSSVLGKPVLVSIRKQSVVRQLNAFKSERPQMSKPRFASQVNVNNNLSRPLDEARKKTQERDRNSKTSVMPFARFESTADGRKPKPRSTNHSTRSLPVSKSSCVTIAVVPIADHSKNSNSFSDSKHFVCSAYHKCVFNANHDACIIKLLKKVNLRAKIQSHKTKNGNTGRIFKSVGLRWIPTEKLFDSCTGKDDSEPTHGLNVDIPNIHECKTNSGFKCRNQCHNGFKNDEIAMTFEYNELESLFGPSFDEYFNGKNQVVSNPSVVITADASDKRQQQPYSTSSTSTLATTITADGNFDFEDGNPACANIKQALGSIVKKLTKPLDELEREFRRLRRATCHLQQNESLAIAQRNLFDDEAFTSNNNRVNPLTPTPRTLHERSYPNSFSFQNLIILSAKQTGRIIDARDILLIIKTCTFQGMRSEDLFHHIKHYLSIVDNIQADGTTKDTSKLGFFHLSIKGIAAECNAAYIQRTSKKGLQSNLLTRNTYSRGRIEKPYLICDYCEGPREADECKQTNQAEHVCLSGGDIYDDPSLMRFYQNDDNPPWRNNKRKEKQEDGSEWTLRSKFKDELANFMLEKKSHANGIGDMLDQHQAMIHMPKGDKVLKDLLSHKEKLEKAASSVKLSEECSAIIQRSLSQKEGDPGSFTLPCLIGPLAVKNALANLGASINLMPHSLF
nr:hypothetical protein [Tanacetum cinerariifolium]